VRRPPIPIEGRWLLRDPRCRVMTPLHKLSLTAVVLVGIPTAGFAVTGLDAEGNPNGTPGSLTAPNPTNPSMSGQMSSQAAPPRTGITVRSGVSGSRRQQKALQEKLTGATHVRDRCLIAAVKREWGYPLGALRPGWPAATLATEREAPSSVGHRQRGAVQQRSALGTRPHVQGASRKACRPTIDGLSPRIIADRSRGGSGNARTGFVPCPVHPPTLPPAGPSSRFVVLATTWPTWAPEAEHGGPPTMSLPA
jgi:hypothetical protein